MWPQIPLSRVAGAPVPGARRQTLSSIVGLPIPIKNDTGPTDANSVVGTGVDEPLSPVGTDLYFAVRAVHHQ